MSREADLRSSLLQSLTAHDFMLSVLSRPKENTLMSHVISPVVERYENANVLDSWHYRLALGHHYSGW